MAKGVAASEAPDHHPHPTLKPTPPLNARILPERETETAELVIAVTRSRFIRPLNFSGARLGWMTTARSTLGL